MKYGPTKGELWFRFWVSIFGLAFMIFAVTARGVSGIAWIEVVGISTVFFGGTAVWTAWKLFKTET